MGACASLIRPSANEGMKTNEGMKNVFVAQTIVLLLRVKVT